MITARDSAIGSPIECSYFSPDIAGINGSDDELTVTRVR
jgi:hypothetical protein